MRRKPKVLPEIKIKVLEEWIRKYKVAGADGHSYQPKKTKYLLHGILLKMNIQ